MQKIKYFIMNLKEITIFNYYHWLKMSIWNF